MRFIELYDTENGYDYQVNVNHIVWFTKIEVMESEQRYDFFEDNDIERTLVKLSDGKVIQVSQTVKEIYNAL